MDNTPLNTSDSSSDSTSSIAAIIVLFAAFAIMLIVVLASTARPVVRVETTPETEAAVEPTAEVVVVEPTAETVAVAYSEADVNAGRDIFLVTCSACHGQNAQGIQGLGKNLITSELVTTYSDAALAEFIIVGRLPSDPANTTGIPMPARGGNPSLTDAQIGQVVAYLRSTIAAQDLAVVGGGVQSVPTANPQAAVLEPFELPGVVAAAANASAAAIVAPSYSAAETYGLLCAGCHGADGRGVVGLDGAVQPGSNLRESDTWNNGEAVIALLTGQPQFPAEGGFVHPVASTLYPPLTTQGMAELIGYLFTLE